MAAPKRPRSGSNKMGQGLAAGGKRKARAKTGGVLAPRVHKVSTKTFTLKKSSNWLGRK